jgi:hypothetical protein
VREYVACATLRTREMFVPLSHRPGHAQADFGEADAIIAGQKVRFHYFCMDLPHSDDAFVKAYCAETAEAFCDGHVSAFAHFGGVPQSILYDNTKLAVAKIVKGGRRLRSRMFAELQSHYLFADRFGRPGKGNDKGKVEGLVGYIRRNAMTPMPVAASFEALNAHLVKACLKRRSAILRGHAGTIGERLGADLAAFMPLPANPYDACHKVATRVSSLSLVRYRNNDYSVPTRYGHQEVLAKGYVDRVEIACRDEIIAIHPRSYETADFVYNPLHYLALLEHKSKALDQAAPLDGWQLGECLHRLRRLMEARDERRLRALQKHLNSVRLLIVDELGYVPFTAVGSELFFEVLSQRYERGATLITSNLPFDEWTSVFGSERLTGALLDRLTHHVHILEMNGESFRLATSKKAQRRSAHNPSGATRPSTEGEKDSKI